MRCKFCGSNALHSAEERRGFSAGKAVAGTIVFGPVGTVAGLAGKTIHGYRCASCGAFMDLPMDNSLESRVNDAIYQAKKGSAASMYDYYKKQYPNIEDVAVKQVSGGGTSLIEPRENARAATMVEVDKASKLADKRDYMYDKWSQESPVYIKRVIIKSNGTEDILSLEIWNQTEHTIRSLYLQVSAYDDTNDLLTTSRCVYQGLSIEPGAMFPLDHTFGLGTDLSYQVDVFCEKAAFDNGEVWRNEGSEAMLRLEEAVPIDSQSFPRYKYLKAEYEKIQKKAGISKRKLHNPDYLPVFQEDYWRCVCSTPSKEEQCPICRCKKTDIMEIISQEYLENKQHEAVINRAAERAKGTQAAYEVAIEKPKRETYEKALKAKNENTILSLNDAVAFFANLGEYKDSKVQLESAKTMLAEAKEQERIRQEEAKAKEEEREQEERIAVQKKRKLAKKIVCITIVIVLLSVAFVVALIHFIIPKQKLNKAMELIDSGNYDEAYALLEEIGDNETIASSKSDRANALIDSGNYDEAYILLEEIGDNEAITSSKYDRANALLDSGDYEEAYKLLEEIGDDNTIIEDKYDRAITLIEAQEYEEAYILLDGLNYKDSAEKVSEITPFVLDSTFSNATIGSSISFGTYEQDNDPSNGKEPIEWIVLAESDEKVLMISKYVLDRMPYKSAELWLNQSFKSEAFTSEEQAMISAQIGLLSDKDAKQYFKSNKDRICAPTRYAIGRTVKINDEPVFDENGNIIVNWWWLIDSSTDSYGKVVDVDGSIDDSFTPNAEIDLFGIRPAMWVKKSKVFKDDHQ